MYTKYAAHRSGAPVQCMVAGDDVVVFAHKLEVDPFILAYKQYVATSDKQTPKHGLGQVVKDYIVRPWWNIDFCSKFSVHVGDRNTYEGWYILRDPCKLIETKQVYTGTNAAIRRNA